MNKSSLIAPTRRGLFRIGSVGVLALAAVSLGVSPAWAARAAKSTSSTSLASTETLVVQTGTVTSPKIAADLLAAINASSTPRLSWAKDIDGVRYVKAIVVGTPTADPELTSLRNSVLAAGGSIYFRYTSVAALSVLLPAQRVIDIANRADVQTLSPNRMTARTATTLTPSHLEQATGVTGVRSRSQATPLGYSGLDGAGIGIAVLDSGVMPAHALFADANGATRVRKALNILKTGDVTTTALKDWTPGVDQSAALYPASPTLASFASKTNNAGSNFTDGYGHGTHVAGVAAGRDLHEALDTTGIAPGATLFDVKVLDDKGFGQLSDVLAGIDWVIYYARTLNIRVLNLSLAADSTEGWQTDPLARAVRSASAAGITVVVAAGNFGQAANGAERFGTISSPGHDPSVITVGSANTRGTGDRADDSVNFFSSRGPTRGASVGADGVRRVDNLLKPDLVAPGNKIVSALSVSDVSMSTWSLLPQKHWELGWGLPNSTYGGRSVMRLSGTSIAAPVVAGAAALLLQANPGLTPPLVKAILQYTAQPIAGANLLQQGAGLLNIEGAVRLAQALRTDVAAAVQAGTIAPGAALLAAGKAMPEPVTLLDGKKIPWSRIVVAGGSHVLSGSALFTQYQPIYDPRLTWVRDIATRRT
ncbi:MAG: S8 family serine peptidase, partial [Rubrivivax sp.]|nr:S8 family serine peptidase [Rubrivivax sp.]